jgi:Ni,Fe-hydrogenase I cytochrome b subunit
VVSDTLRAFPVRDRGTRLFHWITFLSVLALAGIGTVMWFNDISAMFTGQKVMSRTPVDQEIPARRQ